MTNLSPQQFVQQHADFHKWAKSEVTKEYESHTVGPGHVSFVNDRPAGQRVAQLRSARAALVDFYSPNARPSGYGSREDIFKELGHPLTDLLPEHLHPLVDQYHESRGDR